MIEAEIKGGLRSLREAMDRGDGDGIAGGLVELDRLCATHGKALNPQLVHFLQRRSYEKAWLFLGGESDIPADNCGGRA